MRMGPSNRLSPDLKEKLDREYEQAPELKLGEKERLVVVSDLHMGGGGRKDEFVPNSLLLQALLRRYYLERRFILALNGDIEDLAGFSLARIATRWLDVYALWQEFAERGALYKIAGNHDLELLQREAADYPFPVIGSLRVACNGHRLWLFHGHQVSRLERAFQALGPVFLRGVLHPLGIGNYTVRRSTSRRFHVERRSYLYARERRILALIGHTHRPLFESLSGFDAVKIEIENLCRAYPTAGPAERQRLEERVAMLRLEYTVQQTREMLNPRGENLYGAGPLLPCLFNSGSGIGRHGVTAIEIAGGRIALVIWLDRRRTEKYGESAGYRPERLEDSDYYRVVLKEDDLDYIFARIHLLG